MFVVIRIFRRVFRDENDIPSVSDSIADWIHEPQDVPGEKSSTRKKEEEGRRGETRSSSKEQSPRRLEKE